MMQDPESKGDSQEETFEWVQENGKLIKITDKNSNGRQCIACGCNCPCDCSDCRPICCTTKHRIKTLLKKK